MPAAGTQTAGAPYLLHIRSYAFWRKETSVTSPMMASATGLSMRSLMIRATLITLSLRSTRPTAPMPRSASSIATDCPIPLPAPVMMADLPLMFMLISSSRSSANDYPGEQDPHGGQALEPDVRPESRTYFLTGVIGRRDVPGTSRGARGRCRLAADGEFTGSSARIIGSRV